MTLNKNGTEMYWNITRDGKMKRVSKDNMTKTVGACPWIKKLRKTVDGRVSPSQLKEIQAMQVKAPESLSATLKNTRQPAKRAKLQSQMKNVSDGRGAATRGWAAAAPQKGYERHILREKCGSKCFLKSPEGFPICPKCKGKSCNCSIDCRGVLSAKIRANQWKYPEIAKMADNIGRSKCKGWTSVWA